MSKLQFVTGRLAEPALRQTLAEIEPRIGHELVIQVLPISVAALMTPRWVARHLEVAEGVTRVILPGFCEGDLTPLQEKAATTQVERGPRDLRDLPQWLLGEKSSRADLDQSSVEILAEINHAPRLGQDAILRLAEKFRRDGADIVDLGCDPGEPWTGVGASVRELKREGFRVSIDSFNPIEVEQAVEAGAELVLSVDSTNRERAVGWGVEVVVVPDEPHSLIGLFETSDYLREHGVPHRLDPILDPIGIGFAQSLGRYLEVRTRRIDQPIMMGIGNLTELTDVDSAGVNALLIGFCQELGIGSVLTTEVINWARTSVREIDLARRLMRYAVTRGIPPKRVDPSLVVLRDPRLHTFDETSLQSMASRIKDRNWRLFAEAGELIAINSQGLHRASDPFVLFDQMQVDDPSHAFYLGYELAKARIALTLGKNYRQDQALEWGYLTVPEPSHRNRTQESATTSDPPTATPERQD